MAKKMCPLTVVLLASFMLFLGGLVINVLWPIEEAFGASQPGTLVQLQSTHVATLADVEAAKKEAEQVKKEIVDMTGYW